MGKMMRNGAEASPAPVAAEAEAEGARGGRLLNVPLLEPVGFKSGRHVEMQLNGEQALALARLRAGLEGRGYCCDLGGGGQSCEDDGGQDEEGFHVTG